MNIKPFSIIGLALGLLFTTLSSAAFKSINASEWKSRVTSEFTDEMCIPDSYMMSCFNLKTTECRISAEQEFSKCAKEVPLPKKINPYTDGISTAQKVGRCAGNAMEKQMALKKKTDERCRKPASWM